LSSCWTAGADVVTFREVIVCGIPADRERLARTSQVYLSLAGCEYTPAINFGCLNIPSTYKVVAFVNA
jgi:hypothetical protein